MIALIRECSFDAQEAINAVRYELAIKKRFPGRSPCRTFTTQTADGEICAKCSIGSAWTPQCSPMDDIFRRAHEPITKSNNINELFWRLSNKLPAAGKIRIDANQYVVVRPALGFPNDIE